MPTWKDAIDEVVQSTLQAVQTESDAALAQIVDLQAASNPDVAPSTLRDRAAQRMAESLAADPVFTGEGYPTFDAPAGKVPPDATVAAGGHLFLPSASSVADWQPTTVMYSPPTDHDQELATSAEAAYKVASMFEHYRLVPLRRVAGQMVNAARLPRIAPIDPRVIAMPGWRVVPGSDQGGPGQVIVPGWRTPPGAEGPGQAPTDDQPPTDQPPAESKPSTGTWWKILLVLGAAGAAGFAVHRALAKPNPVVTFTSPRQAGAAAELVNKRLGRQAALVRQVDFRTWSLLVDGLTDIELEKMLEGVPTLEPRFNHPRWQLIDESGRDANTRARVTNAEKMLDPNVTAWITADLARLRSIFGEPTRLPNRLRWLLHSSFGDAEIVGFGEAPTVFALHLDRRFRAEHRNGMLAWLDRKGVAWQWAQGARAWY